MKTFRPIVLLLLLICSTYAIPAHALVKPCYLASPGELCSTTIWQTLGDSLNRAAKGLGEAIGAALVDLKAKLQAARTQVFSSNLSGAQLEQAQAELGQLLSAKDYYLCLVDVMLAPKGPGNRGAAGPFYDQLQAQTYHGFADFDGNIPPFARGLFNVWTRQVEERLHSDAPPRSLTEVFSRFQNAIQKTMPAYEHYEIARDWAEYAAADRNLTQDPRQYAVLLIAIERPWVPSDFPVKPNIMDDSSKYYSAMAALFGQEALDKAVKTVMTSKKNQNGRLAPALRAGGAEYSHPWPALWAARAKPARAITF